MQQVLQQYRKISQGPLDYPLPEPSEPQRKKKSSHAETALGEALVCINCMMARIVVGCNACHGFFICVRWQPRASPDEVCDVSVDEKVRIKKPAQSLVECFCV